MMQDHPRSRGNNLPCAICCKSRMGSPPLAREQLIVQRLLRDTGRITPARAGTTCINCINANTRQDHPRSRGNNKGEIMEKYQVSGSPPLAREQHLFSLGTLRMVRITPARAGTT